MNFAEDKGDAVFEFLRYGYRYGARVMKMLHVPAVMRVMELSRKTSNEAHSFIEFILSVMYCHRCMHIFKIGFLMRTGLYMTREE